MKPDCILLITILVGFSWHAYAADNPQCLVEYKAEVDRITRDAERAALANPAERDIEAQQQLMLPIQNALKKAAQRAEQCNRNSRPPLLSIDANIRLTHCADTASQQIDALHRRYANHTTLSRYEQMEIRNQENRIYEEREKCMHKDR